MDQDEAWLAEGIQRYEEGDLVTAEEVLSRIGVTSPLCRDALLARSAVMAALGRGSEALRCAQEADNLDRDARSLYQLGVCHMTGQRYTVARELFQDAIERHPGYVDAHVMLGHVVRELGEPDNAIRCYEEALRTDDAHAGARFYLAEVLIDRRELNRASTQLHYLLKANPSYGPAMVLLGDIAFFREDFRQAAAEYVRAHHQGESDSALLYRLGRAFATVGDAYQACKAFDRALKTAPSLWDAHLAAAALCEKQGWYNRARRYLEALAFVQAHRTEAYKGLARLEAAILRTGLAGIDPAGAPEDTFDYLEGPFVPPAELRPEDVSRGVEASAAVVLAPQQVVRGPDGDAYGVGARAAAYLADFVAPPPRPASPPPPPPPPPAPRKETAADVLQAWQQRLREKLAQENEDGTAK